ncbi:MAG: hypothetical protein QOG02_205 [Gaiellales bacterium]|jgi:DNA-binding transcriptional ArsR family regulator|nr:hypothetical protein [Gaiellales bacterium]
MANQSTVDGVFSALSDPTRRAVVRRLGGGPATVTHLATPFDMRLPSFLKHLRVLEDSGIIRTRKQGRTRTCMLRPESLEIASAWLETQRQSWEANTDRLEVFVTKEHQS